MSNLITNNNIFYVYVYCDPRKPGTYVYGNYIFEYEPFYVGKGSNGRLYEHLKGNKYNKHLDDKIKKIRKECGSDPFIIKVNEGLTENISFELERELICVIGRLDEKLGPLYNHTNGGEGTSEASRKRYMNEQEMIHQLKEKSNKRVMEMIDEGKTYRVISKETGLSLGSISKIKKRHLLKQISM